MNFEQCLKYKSLRCLSFLRSQGFLYHSKTKISLILKYDSTSSFKDPGTLKLKDKIFGKTNKQSDKYVAALGQSRSNFADKLNALAARYRSIDEDYFDELEEILIEADIGVKIVM